MDGAARYGRKNHTRNDRTHAKVGKGKHDAPKGGKVAKWAKNKK